MNIVVLSSKLQPSSARALTTARGMKPAASRSSTDAAPWRLLSLRLSSPRMSGMWAYSGGVPPSARITIICLGVLEMWSSPRMTWLMPISRSSTAAARL